MKFTERLTSILEKKMKNEKMGNTEGRMTPEDLKDIEDEPGENDAQQVTTGTGGRTKVTYLDPRDDSPRDTPSGFGDDDKDKPDGPKGVHPSHLQASKKVRGSKKEAKGDDEDESELDAEDTLGEEVDCTARANAVKQRTGSAAQAQSEYNRCKKEEGDNNRDDSNPANQKAKEVMQRGSSFTKRGKFGEAKDWINKAADSIEDRGTEGKCTPITKKGCTGRAEALAKTFKKIGKKRDAQIVSKKEKAAKKK